MKLANSLATKAKTHLLKYWPTYGLILLATFGFFIALITFYPGRLSPDSIDQLCQARSECHLATWHPISMALLWRASLHVLHNNYSGLLLLQLSLLWGGLLFLALIIYKDTGNKKYPFLVAGIGFLPFVISISGIVWKDIQLASSLLMAFVLLMYLYYFKINYYAKYGIGLIASLLIWYGLGVRVNSIASIVPLLILLISIYLNKHVKHRKTTIILTTTGVLIVGLFLVRLLNKSTKAYLNSSVVTVYVLDINNLQDKDTILKNAPPDIREPLTSFAPCSLREHDTTNLNVWGCTPDTISLNKQLSILSHGDAFNITKRYWLTVVLSHPFAYIAQKAETYTQFLLNTNFYWMSHDSNEQITHKDSPRPGQKYIIQKSANSILANYVENFGVTFFEFLYKAWFWLLASIVLLFYSKKLSKYKPMVITLASSALLNILSYAPGSLTPDYRFIYWSALACTVAFVLFIIDLKTKTKQKSHS